MATVIDALLVTLGLDPSGFERGAERAERAQQRIETRATQGASRIEGQERRSESQNRQRTTRAEKERLELERKQREARDKQAKDMDAKAKQAVQGFSKMRNEALSFFAAVVGATGIKNFLENMIGTAAGLDRVSANLGMSAKDLSMWQLANERAGGSAEGMTAQLKESAAEIAKFKSMGGPTEGMTWFFRLGGNEAALKDGNTYLRARSDILAKLYKIDPTRAALMAANMGIGEDTFNLLKQGNEIVEEQRQAQARLADEMAKNAPGAEDLRKKLNDLKNEFTTLGVKVLPLVIPQLERFTSWLVEVSPKANGFMDGAIKGIERFGNIAGPILQMVTDGWKNIFGWVAILGDKIKTALPQSWTDWIGEKMHKYFGSSSAPAASAPAPAPAASQDQPAGTRPPGTNKALPRGMRNNNPGNIEYGPFAKKHGATGSDGRFAIFPTMEAGQAAMQALLGGYLDKGHNTVNKAINRWAPGFENNTSAYVNAVSKQIGVGPDQKLDKSHLPALAEAISRHENGPAWARRNAEAAANMPTGAGAAAAARRGGTGVANTSTTDVKVGQITINTKATDAKGIAASIGPAMTNYGFLAQANAGVN